MAFFFCINEFLKSNTTFEVDSILGGMNDGTAATAEPKCS